MKAIYRYRDGQWSKTFIEIEKVNEEQATWTEHIHQINGAKGNLVLLETEEDREAIQGSYVYYQNLEEEHDNQVMKFYLTQDELVIIDLDVAAMLDHTEETLLQDISKRSPIDTFYIIIKKTTDNYLKQIDTFEDKLHHILWRVRTKNNQQLLNEVAEADHQLLICKTQIVTVTEIFMVTEEAFGESNTSGKYYDQLNSRLKRAKFLIDSYEEELDALLDFESIVSSHRGNEITKTLTVFTALFAPATLLGAIWGMNFKHMPELDDKLGYGLSLLMMALVTLAVYFYLRGKGWMGDLLDSKDKKRFF